MAVGRRMSARRGSAFVRNGSLGADFPAGESLPLRRALDLAGPLLREYPQRPKSESQAGSAVTG
jgi:hypothetical protein